MSRKCSLESADVADQSAKEKQSMFAKRLPGSRSSRLILYSYVSAKHTTCDSWACACQKYFPNELGHWCRKKKNSSQMIKRAELIISSRTSIPIDVTSTSIIKGVYKCCKLWHIIDSFGLIVEYWLADSAPLWMLLVDYSNLKLLSSSFYWQNVRTWNVRQEQKTYSAIASCPFHCWN